jgi:hypothetical protein
LVAILARDMISSITSLLANSLPPPISLVELPFHHLPASVAKGRHLSTDAPAPMALVPRKEPLRSG